jgi:hypothetical protein
MYIRPEEEAQHKSMEYNRIIRVSIDPPPEPKRGFLHQELRELREALETEGGLRMFELPSWFHRANTNIVKNTPAPTSETAAFHNQIHADMKEMLDLLTKMATMMAAWQPPNTGTKPHPAPAQLPEGGFFLIQSD